MAVSKVIELLASSPDSWEDAVQVAVQEAWKTEKGFRRVYVKSLMCNVRDGKVVEYRAEVRISVPV